MHEKDGAIVMLCIICGKVFKKTSGFNPRYLYGIRAHIQVQHPEIYTKRTVVQESNGVGN